MEAISGRGGIDQVHLVVLRRRLPGQVVHRRQQRRGGLELWTYSSPELYEPLLIRRGWPPEQYGRFVGPALAAGLLPAQTT